MSAMVRFPFHQELKMGQNSKTQNMTKLKCDKTQNVTKLKISQNSKILNVTKPKLQNVTNSKSYN